MADALWILAGLVLTFVALPWWLGQAMESRRRRALQDQFDRAQSQGVALPRRWAGCGNTGLALSADGRQLCLASRSGYSLLPLDLVRGSEIHHDHRVLLQASRSGGLGRAALGGLLFGGVGAIVGAATAGHRTDTLDHDRYQLHLLLDDTDRPHFCMDFARFEEAKALQALLAASQGAVVTGG